MDERRRASGTVEKVERESQVSLQVNGVQSAIQGRCDNRGTVRNCSRNRLELAAAG